MQLEIRVAVKPYVKKFIGASYAVNPFVLTTNNMYGIFLFHSLEKPRLTVTTRADIRPEETMDPAIYYEQLPVLISENFWNKKGCIIPADKQYHFNKFVSYQFYEEFYKYVQNRLGPKGSINQAILNFREVYDISEDELSFKTIQRAFQRRNAPVKRSLSA